MAAKKGLHPVIAFGLMLVMLCCALLLGANKAFVRKQEQLQAEYGKVNSAIELRVETAYNLLTVSSRHLPKEDELILAVRNNLADMENAGQPLTGRVTACGQFLANAQALLKKLASQPSAIQDSRDHMYATLMLPQAVEQCQDQSAFRAYDSAASAFNDDLKGSFSGLLARITGVQTAQLTSGEAAEEFLVMPSDVIQ